MNVKSWLRIVELRGRGGGWSGRSLAVLISLLSVLRSQAEQAPVNVNRSVPQVEPPRAALAFSAHPRPEEFLRARVFGEPLVPVGGEPTAAENVALAAALLGYAKRGGPDDFASLTGFLEQYPASPWAAAMLTDLGLEYYNTAHYSLAMEAWSKAWTLAKEASGTRERALADRAFAELLTMNARLGRMEEMTALLKSIEQRPVTGPATERVTGAREALWGMQNIPQVCFRCGPLALRSLRIALHLNDSSDLEIMKSASSQKGCSLAQVAELSSKVGLNYQMAFRSVGADFILPAVVHWKVGHYAALLRKEGNLYELQDPTFGNSTWATKEALEAETTGYFLVPAGALPLGWRRVAEKEGGAIWGKGQTAFNDSRQFTKRDLKTSDMVCRGMPAPSIHLMLANLNLNDEPLGYSPPVGPAVRLMMRYNQRDSFQPANFNYSNFGYKWTCDWISYITDNPSNLLADVNLYVGGGGVRTFTGFDTISQSFAPQQYDQTLLKRTGPASYELLSGDGSKMVFSQSDGSIGTTRNVFLTQIVDPRSNALTLTYDSNLRIVAVTDAIGQVTTLTYGIADDVFKITQVTDPFGRSAMFGYEQVGGGPVPFIRLTSISDVIGLTSRFVYNDFLGPHQAIWTSFIAALITPYGTNIFTSDDMGLGQTGNDRFLEINYPDGSRERVEYTQTNAFLALSDPPASVPAGMLTLNSFLRFRNTYYWDRNACAVAYRDYSKARLYHWMHKEDLSTTSGALESMKMPLEGRVWYDYQGQTGATVISPSTALKHEGRVLDDGSTQLYTYASDQLGHVTNSIDPVGRTFSFIYDTNGIDLLAVRQTRSGNELLFKATYNSQHLPLTVTDAAGQTTRYGYNARGQLLSITNARNEAVTFAYDGNGYLLAIDGPLPGTNDISKVSYDGFGRPRTLTDVSGYTMTLDYDNLNRPTQITFPDATFAQITYDRLDPVIVRDRAGRLTLFNYDRLRQLVQLTDPLNRVTRFDWCRCGALKSLVDPLGRTTSWLTDVQGRRIGKRYGDGSQVNYFHENATSRLGQVVDEKQQATLYTYNLDNTPRSIVYANAAVPTPGVTFTYGSAYKRITSMTDGIGTTMYSYNPITDIPGLGAGLRSTVTGPLPNVAVTYRYDELGRRIETSINGVTSARSYDPRGRVLSVTNALGTFTCVYDGSSRRLLSESYPNGQTTTIGYGDNLQDFLFQQITNAIGATPISEFSYVHDIPREQITAWSQQPGSQASSLFSFAYDAVNQLLSATVTNFGTLVSDFAYSYDEAGNRLTELAGGTTAISTYNALNQLSTEANAAINSRTNEWDAQNRLTAVNAGNHRTEFAYDGLSRLAYIRELQNGSEISFRRFVWCNGRIWEERDKSGAIVNKRFFSKGVKLETGTNAGAYYYARDHLGSIRELTDAGGNVRSRYAYDPYGRRTKVSGDMDADFGFAGMFFSSEASLSLTHFRAYDAELGRWLSRDPLSQAEMRQGPNLYAYVGNDPVSFIDPLGTAPRIPRGLVNVIKPPPEQPAPPMNPKYAPTAPTPTPEPAPEPAPELVELEATAPELLELEGPSPELVNWWFEGAAPDTAGSLPIPLAPDTAPLEIPNSLMPGGGGAPPGPECAAEDPANPVADAFFVGYFFGTFLNYEFDISGRTSDLGELAEEEAEHEGLGHPLSFVIGGYATLEALGNPFLW